MEKKELRRLKRADLLEILYEQSQRIDQLEGENAKLKHQLFSKQMEMKKAGSLAEQAVKISQIFESAQEAANLYLENVYRIGRLGSSSQPSDKTKKEDIM